MGCKCFSEKKPNEMATPNQQASTKESMCHFCKKSIPQREYNAHTVQCDEREVTCWHSWCRKIVKQRDLHSHMEQCAKLRKVMCVKCGESILSMEMAAHRDSCHLVQCEHCPEQTIARIRKYCPVSNLETLPLTVGPFATETLKRKFESSKNPRLEYNVGRIQHLWRWTRSKNAFEDILFRMIWKEMDVKKEGFAIFKAHDKVSEAHILAPKRSRSVIQQAAVPGGDRDHYFPTSNNVAITLDHVHCLIEDLRRGILLPFAAAWRIFTEASQLLGTLPNIQALSPPNGARLVNGRWSAGGKIIIVGDLHGQLSDLLHILRENGMPGESTLYVFNGDFIDRGAYGVEVILILFSLLLSCPRHVALNRGNHECDYMNEEYGFDVEISTKYDRNVYRLVQRCFCALPLAAMIGKDVFVVHGGIPRRSGVCLQDIQRVQRFRQIPMPELQQPEEDEIFQDLMWSDPWDQHDWQESDRGAGVQFGPNVTEDFLKLNKMKLIVRSHEEYMKGYEEHHGGKLITVFSASNYDGPETNNGAILTLVGDCLEPSFQPHHVAEDEFFLDAGAEDLSMNRTMSFSALSTSFSTKQISDVQLFGNQLRHKHHRVHRSRDEVLRVLREKIYQRRHRLLAYFTKLDRTQKGSVWKIEWVEVMRNVLNLDLPWFFLREYVAAEDPQTHRIHYAQFLSRFHNHLTLLWLKEWENSMAQQIRMQLKLTHRFQHLHVGFSNANVNYNTYCSVMRAVDYTLSDAQLFQLFVYFDRELRGHINGYEFLEQIDSQEVNRRVGTRWELDAMEQLQNATIQGRSQLQHVFQITSKDKTLTKEKFMKGMALISKGMKKQLTLQQQDHIFNFLDKEKKSEFSFDRFLQAFSVYDAHAKDHLIHISQHFGMSATFSAEGVTPMTPQSATAASQHFGLPPQKK